MIEIPFLFLEFVFALIWLAIRVGVWCKQKHIDWKREAVLLLMYINLAVIIHNIPEGLSVGVAIAAALNNDIILMSEALVLSMGIGIQICGLNGCGKSTLGKAFQTGRLYRKLVTRAKLPNH